MSALQSRWLLLATIAACVVGIAIALWVYGIAAA